MGKKEPVKRLSIKWHFDNVKNYFSKFMMIFPCKVIKENRKGKYEGIQWPFYLSHAGDIHTRDEIHGT